MSTADARQINTDATQIISIEFAIAQLIPATVERAWQVGSFQALEEFQSARERSYPELESADAPKLDLLRMNRC